MKKIGIFSHDIPPSKNGHSLVIERLFDDYKDNAIVFTEECDTSFFKNVIGVGAKDNKKKTYLIRKNDSVHRCYNAFIGKYKYDAAIKQFEAYLDKNEVDVLIVFSGEIFYPEICRRIAEEYNIPFYFYMLDDYEDQWLNDVDSFIAKDTMYNIAKSDLFAGFIVTNEVMKEKYDLKYSNLKTFIVRNPMPDLTMDEDECLYDYPKKCERLLNEYNIVYTGSIYDAHFDAFETLICAVELYNSNFSKNIYIDIYTGQKKSYINNNVKNFNSKFIRVHDIIEDNKELLDIQKSATLLYLPLGLHTKYPKIINTSSPGKLGEYLVSGVPILARVPNDSYISKCLGDYMNVSCCDKQGAEELYFNLCDIMMGKYDDIKIFAAFEYGMNEFGVDVNKERLRKILER